MTTLPPALQAAAEQLRAVGYAVTAPNRDKATIANYEEALADLTALVRRLDVALNGLKDAARPASLRDIVGQVEDQRWRLVRVPDPAEAVPEPTVGQVWVSPKPRVEVRTVTGLSPDRWWPADGLWVYFTVPNGTYEHSLHLMVWTAWARRAGARPAATQATVTGNPS